MSVLHLLPHPEIKLSSLGEPGTVQTCQTCLHPFCFSRFLLPSFSPKFIGVSADPGGRTFPPHLWLQSNEEPGGWFWKGRKTRSWIPLGRSLLRLYSYSPATPSSNRLCCMAVGEFPCRPFFLLSLGIVLYRHCCSGTARH